MYAVLKEIRDDIRTTLNVAKTAESGTTTTNIKITAHGLRNGDNVQNTTRVSGVLAITVVDSDNFTVAAVTGQTTGDIITFYKFKHYYVGTVDSLPVNYLPSLSVYGNSTTIEQKTTATDRWKFAVTIEAFTNAFEQISVNELTDDILVAQQELQNIFEARGTNGAPSSSTILYCVRKYIQGKNYLFNDNIVITYDKHFLNNKVYFKAQMKLDFTTVAYPRT